jgi:hypothetical protein
MQRKEGGGMKKEKRRKGWRGLIFYVFVIIL